MRQKDIPLKRGRGRPKKHPEETKKIVNDIKLKKENRVKKELAKLDLEYC